MQANRIPVDAPAEEYDKLFKNLGLIRNKAFTRAAVLLFAKKPSRYFSMATCKIGRFGNSDPSDLIADDWIDSNVFSMPDQIVERMRTKYLSSQISYNGLQRTENLVIPEKALREAILNAVIHRDYSSSSTIMIRIYENLLTIWNAGELIEPLSTEMLKQEHPSVLRNRIIAHIFYRAGYIEAWGRGTVAIVNEMQQAGFTSPEYYAAGGGIKLTFPVQKEKNTYVPENVPENVPGNVPENRQEYILILMKENAVISMQQLANKLNVSIKTIKRDIQSLKNRRYIKRVGPDKGGYWEVLKGS